MIIKCKMCGGDIEFVPGATYGTCEYCGSTSTIPKADDEMALNRYNRANHFRRQCEFDKALAAYEKLLEKDDTDAEAHWGAAISRYGIEYVEDPATGKRIPTCHRLQVTSILADADYLAAVEHAPDSESRRLYEEQAAQIAEIQKGILAISANEKPYDVFICYKETDDNGQRTRDSQWAQDVYYGLTDAGYKVFFSRITLEDKLGQQYEPYIFAALNSAKVMVVIGSKPEYFNAVWVKNEWSRYLALMANDRKRLLIPCYRDMDPYDLPEELSALQSQDMSKIGFMQDLLRGVKKVLSADKQTEPVRQVVQTAAASTAVSPGVTSLLERAYLFMEDGDFNSAAEYLDRVLDIDPKFAPAYVAKACVTFEFNKEANLADATFLYEDNADWQKALRFADAAQKQTYQGYMDAVKTRVQKQIRDYAYDCAVAMTFCEGNADSFDKPLTAELAEYQQMCHTSHGQHPDGNRRKDWQQNEAAFKQAVKQNEPTGSEQSYLLAAKRFDAIGDDEAKECAKQCRNLAEQARQKALYQDANSKMNANTITQFRKALAMFESIPNYKDAKECAEKSRQGIESIQSKAYAEAVEAMQKAGDSSFRWHDIIKSLEKDELKGYRDVDELKKQAQKRYDESIIWQEKAKKKRLIWNAIIIAALVVVAIEVIFVVTEVIHNNKYNNAVALREAGQYEEAIEAFVDLGNYSDAATQVKATYYAEGEAKRDAHDWDDAVTAFTNAGDYSDATTQITETRYQHAVSLYTSNDYAGAAAILINIKGYKDVDSLIANDDNLSAAAAAAAAALEAKFTVGNYVEFGTYPQTSSGTDSTPIEWLVIARDGSKALLISRYGLDAKPYNTSYTSVTWETCTLRTWLNSTFMNKAFTAEEQKAILTTTVDNSNSQGYSGWSTNGGNNTQDKVFILSYAEANKYFGVEYWSNSGADKNTKSRVAPTAYADEQGAYTYSYKTADGDYDGWWWLRSPGNYQNYAALVDPAGSLLDGGVLRDDACVRPALWVNLESGIF